MEYINFNIIRNLIFKLNDIYILDNIIICKSKTLINKIYLKFHHLFYINFLMYLFQYHLNFVNLNLIIILRIIFLLKFLLKS